MIWIKTFCFSPFQTVTADLTSFENSFFGQKILSGKRSLLDEKKSSSPNDEKDQNNNRQEALLEKSTEEKNEASKADLEMTSFDPDMTLMQAMLSWKFISSVIFFMFMTLRYPVFFVHIGSIVKDSSEQDDFRYKVHEPTLFNFFHTRKWVYEFRRGNRSDGGFKNSASIP